METCAQREGLGAYLLGRLAERERRELDAHLAGCPSCRAELAGIARMVERLRLADPDEVDRPPPVPPATLWAEIQDRIRPG